MRKQKFRSLPQALTAHYSNVFILILSLTELQTGIAWIPSNNNNMLFPPSNKVSLWFQRVNTVTITLLLNYNADLIQQS
jgi:hypothetical protein